MTIQGPNIEKLVKGHLELSYATTMLKQTKQLGFAKSIYIYQATYRDTKFLKRTKFVMHHTITKFTGSSMCYTVSRNSCVNKIGFII